MKRIGTSFHMTTAFHPQADGRSERTNRTVGQILRTFTAKRQGKWLESLPAVEYAINSAVDVATGKSPVELILGRAPLLFTDTAGEETLPSLDKWTALRREQTQGQIQGPLSSCRNLTPWAKRRVGSAGGRPTASSVPHLKGQAIRGEGRRLGGDS